MIEIRIKLETPLITYGWPIVLKDEDYKRVRDELQSYVDELRKRRMKKFD